MFDAFLVKPNSKIKLRDSRENKIPAMRYGSRLSRSYAEGYTHPTAGILFVCKSLKAFDPRYLNDFEYTSIKISAKDLKERFLKFFLNVSNQEQKKRFMERLDRPEKNWKFSAGDCD